MRTLLRPTILPAALCAVFASTALPVRALDILLCNDDGISAANVRALKQQLLAAGHAECYGPPRHGKHRGQAARADQGT